jgi:hypothetical protein
MDLPDKSRKGGFYLYITDKQLGSSVLDTDEFKDRYWWRAWVEATISEFDRCTGVKRLRVWRLKAVRFSATLKAFGMNILRATPVMAAIIAGASDKANQEGGNRVMINDFEERL